MTSNESRSRGIRADELMAMLEQDAEFQARKAEREAQLAERTRALGEAERPIVEDLGTAGFQVRSVWDLVNTSQPYPAALPILLAHLERGGYPDRVMESLGRALAVETSVVYWSRLKDRYRHARSLGEREGVAVALSVCATEQHVDDVVSLLHERELGASRIHLLDAFRRAGGARGREVLEGLRSDPELGQQASRLLERRG